MNDANRVPDPPIERDVDPEGDRPVDVDLEVALPESLHDAHVEAPEADALEQALEVPLDDEER